MLPALLELTRPAGDMLELPRAPTTISPEDALGMFTAVKLSDACAGSTNDRASTSVRVSVSLAGAASMSVRGRSTGDAEATSVAGALSMNERAELHTRTIESLAGAASTKTREKL